MSNACPLPGRSQNAKSFTFPQSGNSPVPCRKILTSERGQAPQADRAPRTTGRAPHSA